MQELRRQLRNQKCPTPCLTCHCFPRNSELIRLLFVFFLNTPLVWRWTPFWFYLPKQPRNTKLGGCIVDLHDNQEIKTSVCYCAVAVVLKNQVLQINCKGWNKCTAISQNEPRVSWNTRIFYTESPLQGWVFQELRRAARTCPWWPADATPRKDFF